VRLKIFDINGRPFKTLLDGDIVEERRVTFWDGRVKNGRLAPIGVYIVLMEARPLGGGHVIHTKLPVVLVRR
jgi:flagellar hook assembly protein FlgD